jgi:DNA-binding MarR family transcriptional regulator
MNSTQETPWTNPRFKNWIALVRAEKAVVQALTKALAPLGIKIPQLDILMNIHRHPGLSQHDLARRLLVGRSNITMLLPQMETQGLLRREGDAKDKRVMRLYLTDDGEALLVRALKVYSDLIDRVMAQSSELECNLIGARMTQIAEMLKDEG